MQEEPQAKECPSNGEARLKKTCAALKRITAEEAASARRLDDLLEQESRAKTRLAKAEREAEDARRAYEGIRSERLRERTRRSTARLLKRMLAIGRRCQEFNLKLHSLSERADILALCEEQLADRDGLVAGLHDALLRDVTPEFPSNEVRRLKADIVWGCWFALAGKIEDDIAAMETMECLDRYLHFWCLNRIPPCPWEDVAFRQAADAEWAEVRKAWAESLARLRALSAPAPESAAMETRPASEAFVEAKFESLKRHVTRRVGQLRKPGDTKPGPTMSDERKDDMRRVDAYVREGYSVNKACDMVDAENRERGASIAHYASAAAMRDAYPRWRAAK